MTAFATGLAVGLTLIVAIGAQNVFVLRQGVRREHVGAVIAVCTASDVALIAAGTGGLGVLVRQLPVLVQVARWAGVAFLLCYATLAVRRALAPTAEGLDVGAAETPGARTGRALGPVIGTALALTWLNPHVYLDTVLMLGSIAASHGAQRWSFAFGAMTASLLWFCAIGLGARGLGRVLASPRAWRVLDLLVALTMVFSAILLIVRA